ncbi:7TM diverse intracellular signaling domain-containing protein [Flavobacterium sp. SM2513]|uniref:7TM diverse intracellular signaling domain-containing protein n=1 Tax=Flavobacterium sp. SM2513 TaxID=3424766 RepID=UPI003D7F72C5
MVNQLRKNTPEPQWRYLISIFKFIVFLTVSFSSNLLLAQNKDSIPFQELEHKRIDFIPFVAVYETVENYDVSKVDVEIRSKLLFVPPQKTSQGFSQNYYWLHFDIDWTKYSKSLILELDNPHIDKVVLWKKVNNTYIKIGFGGDRGIVFKERSYLNRRFIFPLENTNTNTEYFLLIDKRNSSVSFPLWLWNKKHFEATEFRNNIFYGIFFGIIFFLGIVALITGILVRKKVFLYYAGYILSMGIYLFSALGFSYQFLYPNAEIFNNYSRVVFSVMSALFLTSFLRRYLKMDRNHQSLSKCYKWINVILMVLLLFWILLPNLYAIYAIILLSVSNVLFVAIIVIAFYVAYKSLKTNRFNAVIFFIAFSAILIGVVLFLSIENGFINENIFPLNPILLGSGLEVAVFSIAMLFQLTKVIHSKDSLELQNNKLKITQKILEQHNFQLESEANEFKSQIADSEENSIIETITIVLKSKAVLQVDDITHISSDSHYLEFYLSSQDYPEIDRNSIKLILEQLPKRCFVQVHRSHIVNINYVKLIKASEIVLKNEISIPISRSFKTQVKDFLTNLN